MNRVQKWAFIIAFIQLILILNSCAVDNSFTTGEDLLKEGNFDRAVLYLQKACKEDPDNHHKLAAYKSARLKASQNHLKAGQLYMEQKNYQNAIEEFRMALSFDPSASHIHSLLDKAQKNYKSVEQTKRAINHMSKGMVEDAIESFSLALELNPENEDARFHLSKLKENKRTTLIQGGDHELNISSNKPITLRFNNTDIKKIFATLSKLSGVNFIFDESVQSENVSINLVDMPFLQALDLLISTNKMSKKIINNKTILIFPSLPDKIKQYQELVIRTFYLSDIHVDEAAKLVKSILKSKQVHINKELNSIVIRDTPDVIKLAEKILSANDIPSAEILFDIEILEVKQVAMHDIGFLFSPEFKISGALGLSGTEIFSGNFMSSPSSPGYVSYNQLRELNKDNFYFSLPAATLNLIKNENGTQILANPKIRVKNKEKASIHIGSRVPIRTNRRVDTTGNVSYDFNYTDIGIKLNVEPYFNFPDSVTLGITLEVSSIGANVGTTDDPQYEINTRNSMTKLQFKNGETVLIGGLIQNDDTGEVTKIPLLGDIPLLKRLFSRDYRSKTKTEVLMSITPYIVRGIDIPSKSVITMWSGQEKNYSLEGPRFEEEKVKGESTETREKFDGTAAKVLVHAPRNVNLGEKLNAHLLVQNAKNLYAAPLDLSYNADKLKCLKVAEGPFLKKDGKQTAFLNSINQSEGSVHINLSRMGEIGGIDGDGIIAYFTFEAIGKGASKISISEPKFLDADMKPYLINTESTVININENE